MRTKYLVFMLLIFVLKSYSGGLNVVVNKKVEFTIGDSAVAVVPGECSEDLDCYDLYDIAQNVTEKYWNTHLISARKVKEVMRKFNFKRITRANSPEIAKQLGVGMFLVFHIRLEDTKRFISSSSDDDGEYTDIPADMEIEVILRNVLNNQELLHAIAHTKSDIDGAEDAVEDAVDEIFTDASVEK